MSVWYMEGVISALGNCTKTFQFFSFFMLVYEMIDKVSIPSIKTPIAFQVCWKEPFIIGFWTFWTFSTFTSFYSFSTFFAADKGSL